MLRDTLEPADRMVGVPVAERYVGIDGGCVGSTAAGTPLGAKSGSGVGRRDEEEEGSSDGKVVGASVHKAPLLLQNLTTLT